METEEIDKGREKYTKRISRAYPGLFVILMDMSGSMNEQWGEGKKLSKFLQLFEIINNFLYELSKKSTSGDQIKDYFHISVIGYGGSVKPLFVDTEKPYITISQIVNQGKVETVISEVDDGVGGKKERIETKKIYVEGIAKGDTPMCRAFGYACKEVISPWIEKYKESFPPVVLNITDGEPTDGNPLDIVNEIKKKTTLEGNVLIFNAHVSSTNPDLNICYPDSESGLPDKYAKMLFSMSSILPNVMLNRAKLFYPDLVDGSHGFLYNTDAESIIRFLNIGSTI